jgi:hypothetical protein
MGISETLEQALLTVPTTPADAATVALARRYAALIDDEGDLVKVGPALLAALVQLGMTPKARSAVTGGGAPDAGRTKLDELRARRAARQHPAAAVD